MALLLDQLVYTSFSGVGLRVLVSAQVPKQIQQAFMQKVVYQHWDSDNPPKFGYRAAYIHEVSQGHTLFGWLYYDEVDDLGHSHVPYFACYYLTELLHAMRLEDILVVLNK